jgi:hypothetical protein
MLVQLNMEFYLLYSWPIWWDYDEMHSFLKKKYWFIYVYYQWNVHRAASDCNISKIKKTLTNYEMIKSRRGNIFRACTRVLNQTFVVYNQINEVKFNYNYCYPLLLINCVDYFIEPENHSISQSWKDNTSTRSVDAFRHFNESFYRMRNEPQSMHKMRKQLFHRTTNSLHLGLPWGSIQHLTNDHRADSITKPIRSKSTGVIGEEP